MYETGVSPDVPEEQTPSTTDIPEVAVYIGEFWGRKVFLSPTPTRAVSKLENSLKGSTFSQRSFSYDSDIDIRDHFINQANANDHVVLNDECLGSLIDKIQNPNLVEIKFGSGADANQWFSYMGEIHFPEPARIMSLNYSHISICENVQYEEEFLKRDLLIPRSNDSSNLVDASYQFIRSAFTQPDFKYKNIYVDKKIFKDWQRAWCCTLYPSKIVKNNRHILHELNCTHLIEEEFLFTSNGINIYYHEDPIERYRYLLDHDMLKHCNNSVWSRDHKLFMTASSTNKYLQGIWKDGKTRLIVNKEIKELIENQHEVSAQQQVSKRKEKTVHKELIYAGYIHEYEITIYVNASTSSVEYMADETGMAYLAIDEMAERGKINNFLETFRGHNIIVTPSVMKKILENRDLDFEKSPDLYETQVDDLIKQQKYKGPHVGIKEASKNTFGGASAAFRDGAKMAAAAEFNQTLVDLAKFALKEFNTPQDILEHKAADALLHLFTPFALLMLTEYLPKGTLPGEKYLKAGAEVAVSAETMKIMMPMLAQIRPKLKEIVAMAKDASGEVAGEGADESDEFESELDDIFASEELEKEEPILVG